MLKRERQAYPLHKINLRNTVLSADLSEDINVPDDTLHRDLLALAEARKQIKFHGAAMSTSFYNGHLARRDIYSSPQKRSIVQTTASRIPDRMAVTTGSGTINIEMARALAQNLQASFSTGSRPAIVEYLNHPTTAVMAMEGKVSKKLKMTAGPEAINRIGGINLDNGVLENNWNAAQMKKAMVKSSLKQVCLTIADKMNSKQPLQVCISSKIDSLTTEHSPGNPYARPVSKQGFRCCNLQS